MEKIEFIKSQENNEKLNIREMITSLDPLAEDQKEMKLTLEHGFVGLLEQNKIFIEQLKEVKEELDKVKKEREDK